MNIIKESATYSFGRVLIKISDMGDFTIFLNGNHIGGVSSDDILEYTDEENLDTIFYDFDREINYQNQYNHKDIEFLSDEEKEFIISEYGKNKLNAKHRDYYDAYDNTWKTIGG